MRNYYNNHLSASRLRQVYELAPPRVKRYLDSEISFVTEHLHPSDIVLELGCGYGRAIEKICDKAKLVVGIDTSIHSLREAAGNLKAASNIALAQMDATVLGFGDKSFDRVICIQNGISAFHVEPAKLVLESLRVTKRGGRLLFSSYAAGFWDDRLEWFRLQAECGLIGEIDWEKTREGSIVCMDGFIATTFSPDDFSRVISSFGLTYEIQEIDGSSLFCVITA